MELPTIYNKHLVSWVNTYVTDPISYATILVRGQRLLDEQEENRSKLRIQQRCKEVKEEIMMRTWHPTRIEKMINLGYDIEDI
jgi:hypothetical protein